MDGHKGDMSAHLGMPFPSLHAWAVGNSPPSRDKTLLYEPRDSLQIHVHFPLVPTRASLTPSLHSLSLQILKDNHVPIVPQIPGPLPFQRSSEASLESSARAMPRPGSHAGGAKE